MTKTLTLFAGVTFVTLLTYQSRINLVTNTANVQKHIDQAKEKTDSVIKKPNEPITRLTLTRPLSPVENFVDDTKTYYKGRLVPSVKASWNAQVISFTSAVIQSNLPTRIGHFIAKNVFGHSKTNV